MRPSRMCTTLHKNFKPLNSNLPNAKICKLSLLTRRSPLNNKKSRLYFIYSNYRNPFLRGKFFWKIKSMVFLKFLSKSYIIYLNGRFSTGLMKSSLILIKRLCLSRITEYKFYNTYYIILHLL